MFKTIMTIVMTMIITTPLHRRAEIVNCHHDNDKNDSDDNDDNDNKDDDDNKEDNDDDNNDDDDRDNSHSPESCQVSLSS